MNILFCSSEVVPFAKTGGLADVAGALPKALEKLGARLKISMPLYKGIRPEKTKPVASSLIGKGLEVLFIKNDAYFNREGLYGNSSGDYPDNLERFSFYCRKTLEILGEIDFKPDIIHCNDWQTALIPVYLKSLYKADSFFKNTKTVFSIHNIAYQGLFPKEQFPQIGIDESFFSIRGLEFYDKINILKGGLVFSDYLSTVSEAYAEEIQTTDFGCGLEGVLRERKDSIYGILNGLDYDIWNPETDELIYEKYSKENLSLKLKNKRELQKKLALTVDETIPVFGMISRLAEQKGVDLLMGAISELMKLDLQLVILGTGEERYHNQLKKVAKNFPGKISLNLKFDERLAHNIYAGSDLFLMPSHYEPCGLGQMISLKYGTIPLVFKTGGLADTIKDFNARSSSGNGFVFDKYHPQEFLKTVKRALGVFENSNLWKRLVSSSFDYHFSWDDSAKHYLKLYEKALANED